jgi:GH25 family lysozyme M1 (1,4-beta-N-acetylmuramidase)
VSQMTAAVRRATRTTVVLLTTLAAMAASSLAFGDGIDVSHWQGTINWTKVDQAGVSFAFMKATESTTYTDTAFAANWSAAKAAGIYRGAYHFAQPGKSSGAAQAQYYVSKVGAAAFKTAGVLPPVLDLEVAGGLSAASLRSWVSSWLQTTESLTGRVPILYFSPSFWTDHMGNSTAYTRYPLWIAHYTTASAPRVPGGWPKWTFWQYTSSGSVSGIAGNVDKNRFNGTTAELAALTNTTGGSTDPVAPGPTVPAGAATTVSMTPATASTAAINEPVTIQGDLARTDGPAPVPNAPVSLLARSAGTSTWSKVAGAVTDTAGHYSVATRVPRATDYQVTYAGDPTYAATSSAIARISTPPRATVRVDLRTNKSYRVRKGTKVMLYGHATTPSGALSGKYVRFYRKPVSGGRWMFVRRVSSVSPTGWYSTNVYPRRSTTYKVVSYATLYELADTSNLVTVRVR